MKINVTADRKRKIEKLVSNFAENYYSFYFEWFETDVLNNEAIETPDEFFYCVFVAKNYFLKSKTKFIKSYVKKGFPLDMRFYIFFAPYCDAEYIDYYYSSQFYNESKLQFISELSKESVSEDLAMMIYSESIDLASKKEIDSPFTQFENKLKSISSNYYFLFSNHKKSATSLSNNLSEFYFLNAKNVIKKLYPEIYIPTLIKIIKKGCSKKSFSYYMDGLLLSLYIDDRIQYEMLLKEENVKKYVDQYKSNELFLLISGNEENIAKKGFVRYE